MNTFIYDEDNIFNKIINRKIKSEILLETEHTILLQDIQKQANLHLLLIPRGNYVNFLHFRTQASQSEIQDFDKILFKILAQIKNYQLITNAGSYQQMRHCHLHILSMEHLNNVVF